MAVGQRRSGVMRLFVIEGVLLGLFGGLVGVAFRGLATAFPPPLNYAVGLAAGALDHALTYARERKQFGKAVAEFQGVQFELARAATRPAIATATPPPTAA